MYPLPSSCPHPPPPSPPPPRARRLQRRPNCAPPLALFASAPGGSIAGEEEYGDFARRVLAQLAARLVRETVGFATGVEGEEVDAEVPWTHPLYRQAFAQVQAELAAEHAERAEAERADREGDEEAPASVAEVEAEVDAEVDELADDGMEVVEDAPQVPQMRAKRSEVESKGRREHESSGERELE
ncbi:hypothetical protein ACG7TL_001770 [Trametes sanguinea]